MKKLLIAILIIILVILFGSIPLSIVSKIFEWLSIGIKWLANILNIFGWNGIL